MPCADRTPYVFTVTLISSYLSDRYKARATFAIVNALVALAGFALYLGMRIPNFFYSAFDTKLI